MSVGVTAKLAIVAKSASSRSASAASSGVASTMSAAVRVGMDPEAASCGTHEMVPPTATSRILGSGGTAPIV